jgi:hypothetical protein
MIPRRALKKIMGNGQFEDSTCTELLDKARLSYNVYHIHVMEGRSGNRQEVIGRWRQIMGDDLIIAERHQDIPKLISDTIIKNSVKRTAKPEVKDADIFL